jgi:hypothetical protein
MGALGAPIVRTRLHAERADHLHGSRPRTLPARSPIAQPERQ